MHLKVLACDVFFREVCSLVVECPHTIDLEFLPKGLHDLGSERMRPRLQERIDAAESGADYDAVCLVYGLCNNGVAGLRAQKLPLVIPRAHDCITLLLGSRDVYTHEFNAHPGTYYRSTGWIEHANSEIDGEDAVCQRLGLTFQFEELAAKYGEDNARYIMDTMGDQTRHYDRLVYIDMGFACEAPFREAAQREAAEKGWNFKVCEGSMLLLRKLLYGPWDDDILVVPAGRTLQPSHDGSVMACQNAAGQNSSADEN